MKKGKKHKKWEPREIAYLHGKFGLIPDMAIASYLGRSLSSVRTRIYYEGLRPAPYRKYSAEDIQYLRDNYRDKGNKEIAGHLSRSAYAIGRKLQDMGLRRTPGQLRRIMDGGGSAAARFKKGIPQTSMPVGTVSVRWHNNKKYVYKHIKTDNNTWEFLHRYNYRMHVEPIGPGEIIVFRDGDTMNCDPGNLLKITRKGNAARNRPGGMRRRSYKPLAARPDYPAKRAGVKECRKVDAFPSPDTDSMIGVMIDKKTIIYIPPGRDPEAARRRYLDKTRRYEDKYFKSRVPEPALS